MPFLNADCRAAFKFTICNSQELVSLIHLFLLSIIIFSRLIKWVELRLTYIILHLYTLTWFKPNTHTNCHPVMAGIFVL